ncbi:hypothetical protein GW535_08010 [Piscirickettsia salmonis]|nr:hypothetical protein GW535_08010 [Piscirickettsia salmonis]
MECADSRHATLCDADSRGFIVVAFCSAILHHWMCKIPTEVATLTSVLKQQYDKFRQYPFEIDLTLPDSVHIFNFSLGMERAIETLSLWEKECE